MPKHKIILSTTEPNNNIPLIRIIQDDKNSQIFEAEIVEEGQLLNFDSKVVFFNAQIGPYKVRDKVETIYYDSSRVSYTLIDPFLKRSENLKRGSVLPTAKNRNLIYLVRCVSIIVCFLVYAKTFGKEITFGIYKS
ncbi:BppU family phage baseplate upper protein [Enterococcus faecium]|nr:BppU family phage baseplate upper protein [Enterococcus faecium]